MADSVDVYMTPEQVAEKLQLAVETVYRWLRSGKLRGARMSQKAWRVTEEDLRSFMRKQNVSELLFEDYLAEYKLSLPDREPSIPGKSRRIDYRLSFENQTLWFEVKEFAEDASLLDGGGGAYDPYVGIRRKIDEASKKFREYHEESCSLVLYNRTINLVDICTPSIVLGAMLGNVSWRIPMDFEKGIETGPPTTFFSDGGKLIHPHTKTPRNTTINAVIALEKLAVGHREFRIALAKKEREEDRRFSWEEFFEFLQSQGDAYRRTALRVLVYENPYAKRRLPANIFAGPFDVRWGPVDGKPYIDRLYVGSELAKLETVEHELELDLGPLQKMMKDQKTMKHQPWEAGYQSRRRSATKAGGGKRS
jgi:excisionase family DNA binding protein